MKCTERDIINYINAWQTDGPHLDATVEDIRDWLMDESLWTDKDRAFFDGWTASDFKRFAKVIREHDAYYR